MTKAADAEVAELRAGLERLADAGTDVVVPPLMIAERELELRREAEERAGQRVIGAAMGFEEAERRADWPGACQALTVWAGTTADRFEHERLSALAAQLDAAWRSRVIGP